MPYPKMVPDPQFETLEVALLEEQAAQTPHKIPQHNGCRYRGKSSFKEMHQRPFRISILKNVVPLSPYDTTATLKLLLNKWVPSAPCGYWCPIPSYNLPNPRAGQIPDTPHDFSADQTSSSSDPPYHFGTDLAGDPDRESSPKANHKLILRIIYIHFGKFSILDPWIVPI